MPSPSDPRRTALLRAVRTAGGPAVWHLAWRAYGECTVATCGRIYAWAETAEPERWLTSEVAPSRCATCHVMSAALFSRDDELRLIDIAAATPPPVAPDPERAPAATPAGALPASLRVGAHTYTVRFDTEAVRKWGLEQHGSDRYGGYSDSWSLEVVLAEQYPDGRPVAGSQLRETMLHELIHVCLRPGNWDADHVAQLQPADREEYTVSILAPALLQVLQDHPALVAFLAPAG